MFNACNVGRNRRAGTGGICSVMTERVWSGGRGRRSLPKTIIGLRQLLLKQSQI